jgi:DnaJ-class molecular chaperone
MARITPRTVECRACDGRGWTDVGLGEARCDWCDGTGLMNAKQFSSWATARPEIGEFCCGGMRVPLPPMRCCAGEEPCGRLAAYSGPGDNIYWACTADPSECDCK